MNITYIFSNWDEVLTEVAQWVRPEAGFKTPRLGSEFIEGGGTSDVWHVKLQTIQGEWKEYALKLFRINQRTNVPHLMEGELQAYDLLAESEHSALPHMPYHGLIAEATNPTDPCGWALMEFVPGRPLSLDQVAGLKANDPTKYSRWTHDVVGEFVKIESALGDLERRLESQNGQIPKSWERQYMDSRLPKLREWKEIGTVTPEHLAAGEALKAIIDALTEESAACGSPKSGRQLIHGDGNFGNIVTNVAGINQRESIAKLIDPLISREAVEANFRHFTAIPEIASDLAAEYQHQTGHVMNERLLFAIGAATHLYMAYADPSQREMRLKALEICLGRVHTPQGIDMPKPIAVADSIYARPAADKLKK